MTIIILNKLDEHYLRQYVLELETACIACGIIIGQEVESEKYVVVHLAKNRKDDLDENLFMEKTSTASISEDMPQYSKGLENINTRLLSNQWSSAVRMIPGSFKVLGIFVVAMGEEILDRETFNIAKQLLYDIHNILIQSKSFEEDITLQDYLFLVYSYKTSEARCELHTFASEGNSAKAIECQFVSQPFAWHMFTCNYELDEVFPIMENTQKFNVEHHFHKTIESVRQILQVSQIFIQNENVDNSLTVDAYLKRRYAAPEINIHYRQQLPRNSIHATIVLPLKCQIYNETLAVKVKEFGGTIRFVGTISSRIYCSPLSTIGDVKQYIRCDVMRSLVARIQIYCDGLTETDIGYEAILISEPPRRVYFHLINSSKVSPIQFSEYIFRNETNALAITQAKQILDVDISPVNIIDNVEAIPDDETFSDFSAELQTPLSQSLSNAARDLNRTMYMLGIIVSLLVLLLSACLHFFLSF